MYISRRDFIKRVQKSGAGAAVIGALGSMAACGNEKESNIPASRPESTRAPVPIASPLDKAYLAVARGNSPELLVQAAVKALGGIERFVKKDYDVIVKPNICVAYHTYEYAACIGCGICEYQCPVAGESVIRILPSAIKV